MRYFLLFIITIVFYFLSSGYVYSQHTFLKLNKDALHRYEKHIYCNSENIHTSVKPYLKDELGNTDSIDHDHIIETNSGLIDNFLNHSPLTIDRNPFKVITDPVLSSVFSYGSDPEKYSYDLAIGFSAYRSYRKFSFITNLIQAYSVFPGYISENADTKGIFPHWGTRYKKNGNIYSKFITTGYFSWSPYSIISDRVGMNMQAGIDKNFWGDGYRSLLLSDNSNAYPFLKLTLNVWKLKYVVLYSLMQDVDYHANTDSLINKYATSHLLSWNIVRRINLYLFESVVWSNNGYPYSRGFDVNYVNPVIFFRPVEFTVGDPSPDNVLMGGGTRIKVSQCTHLYGQVMLDEFNLNEIKKNEGWWGNKYGFQIGMKTYRFLSVKDLFMLLEYNHVRPYTYSHVKSTENYGNSFESLAHPAGANFKEVINVLRYDHNRFSVINKFVFLSSGQDSSAVSLGGNIYKSYTKRPDDYGHRTLQGVRTDIIFNEIKIAFLVNPQYDLSLETGVRIRNERSDIASDTDTYVFFGLRTLLYNDE